MNKLIWICGMPGSGKTTLLHELKTFRPELVCFDADTCRRAFYPMIEYSDEERLANVKILTELACQAAKQGADAAVAAVSGSEELRNYARDRADELGVQFILIHLSGRSSKLWPGSTYQAPKHADLDVNTLMAPLRCAGYVISAFLPQVSYQLFIGRWQPFHDGHKVIILQALEKGPVAIGVRATPINEANPDGVDYRIRVIRQEMLEYDVVVFECPDINSIHIGRDVGYEIVQHAAVPGVSGTELRKDARRENE